MAEFRVMTVDDIPLGMRLKEAAGWNQTQADWRRFLALSPRGCFVASREGQDVGVVATFNFDGVAWIAMVLVDPAARGAGVGTAIMRQALDHLDGEGVRAIRLDATPLGRPIYAKLGFVDQLPLTRYEGRPSLPQTSATDAGGAADGSVFVRPAETGEREVILALDHAVTATARQTLIDRLIDDDPDGPLLAERDGRPVGYALSRPGANARMIGPIVGPMDAAAPLLAACLDRAAGAPVFVDLPDEHITAVSLAHRRGLTPQRPLSRMVRGEPVLEDLTRFVASTGPEKG